MKKIIRGILIVSSVFFMTEIGLRVFAHKKLRKWEGNNYTKDIDLGYRYTPNAEGYFTNVAYRNKYKVNSSGFIWDEFTKEKATGMYRILLLGNSDDTGINTDGPNNYARLLQKKFKESGDKIEIMNLSLDGATRTIKELNFAYKCANKYNPDLILINARYPIIDRVHSKSTYRGVSIMSHHYHESLDETERFIDRVLDDEATLTFIYRNVYFFRYICKFYLERPKSSISKFIKKHILKNRRTVQIISGRLIGHLEAKKGGMYHKEYSKLESLEIYSRASDSLTKMNTKLILFDKYLSRKAKQGLKPYFKNYLNLNLKQRQEYSFGKYDMHCSQKGHQAIFKLLYNKLFTNGIVPEKYFSDETRRELND